MILATKYLDLNTSTVRVAALVLDAVMRDRVLPYNELDRLIRDTAGEAARFNLMPALNLLYLVGRLDYDAVQDVVVHVGEKAETTP